MPRPLSIVLLCLSLPWLAADLRAAEGFEAPPKTPRYKGQSANELEALVRSSYALVEEYARESGQGLSFELSGFQTRPMALLEHEPYAELATLPGGWMLSLNRAFRNDLDSGKRTLTYEYSWDHQGADWIALPEGPRMLNDSIREIFEDVAQRAPEMGHIEQVTQYTVVVALGDRERRYDAAFLWIPTGAANAWYGITNDHIVQGLEVVNAEEIPPLGMAIEVPQLGPSKPLEPPVFMTKDTPWGALAGLEKIGGNISCVPDSSREGVNKHSVPGTNGHITGKHSSQADFTFDCSCDSQCTSRCDASFTSAACAESGFVSSACHKMASASDFSTTGQGNAVVDGATCAGAFACSQKACLFCQCGLEVGLEVTGVTVQFGGGDADWKGNLKASWGCGRCKEDPNAPGGSDTGEEVEFTCSTESACSSPILISMGDGRFSLTSVAKGVAFDLDGDGVLDQTSWTAPGSDEVFLAMDRNGNGQIDDGRELFGDSTQQAPSSDNNGFRALAWYDKPHRLGNGDSRITAEDGIFEHLLLWRDTNHDGVSQADELKPLAESGIVAIDLDYIISGRRDRHGNQYRWNSRVELASGRRFLRATDVIFATANSPRPRRPGAFSPTD